MRKFTDAMGREWRVAVDTNAIRRIRKLVGIDPLDFGEDGGYAQIVRDPVLIADCVYATLEPDVKASGIDADEFGRGMRGDGLGAAARAWMESFADFFPSREMRAALSPARSEGAESVVGGSSTSSPACAESIPAR